MVVFGRGEKEECPGVKCLTFVGEAAAAIIRQVNTWHT